MLNTEKTHSIETNYQLFCDEGRWDYREGGKMSDGLDAESGYLWAGFMHVCPYYSLIAEKNPT